MSNTVHDAVKEYLALLQQGDLYAKKDQAHYGGDSLFLRAVESREGNSVVKKADEIFSKLGWADDDRWKLQRRLAETRNGQVPSLSSLVDAWSAVDDAVSQRSTASAGDDDNKEVQTLHSRAKEKFKDFPEPENWQIVHWAIAHQCFRWSNVDARPITETTPVVLVENPDRGYLLLLKGEYRPSGSGFVYADRWRLGMVPMQNGFSQIVDRAIKAAYDAFPARRGRICWWLERHPRESLWPNKIEGRSVELAANVLGLALLDPTPSEERPVLDETVVASGQLSQLSEKSNGAWEIKPAASKEEPRSRKIFPVGAIRDKARHALGDCRLFGLTISRDQPEKAKEIYEPPADDPTGIGPECIHYAATVGEAYDGMLMNPPGLEEYKRICVVAWGGSPKEIEINREERDKLIAQKARENRRHEFWMEMPTPEDIRKAAAAEKDN